MSLVKRNVGVLAGCQGLLLINNSLLVTVNGLAGFALATDKTLATLPVTTYFLGSALVTLPISFLMKRYGRRAGFTVGALNAILGAVVCSAAIMMKSFWLLCVGTLFFGVYFAAGQYYRFAAADVADASFKSKAISLVLAGGIVGGIVGPETGKLTKDLFAAHPYMGPYLSLAVFALLAILLQRFLDIPALSEAERKEAGRPLATIARQPAFIVAVLAGVIGYGVMNLLMTASPLAIIACQYPFSDAAFVIQWHLVGMFAPSFVTGSLIQRYGLMTIMLTGVALNLGCVAIALAGVDLANFWLALVLLGVGWNFMFVGATSLLTESHTPAERAKVQGANDAAIFLTMVISSAASGALFSAQGWSIMNIAAVPFLLIAGAGITWLALRRRSLRAGV
ncbi:MAG: MFS transporter [Betaproteobacteria bacterium]|nr:MFS transporter [Betaproteobacteria bacterium]